MTATSPRPTAIDLFCGAGGMSLGLEMAGFDVRVGVDNDPVHAATHHYNFPYGEVLAGSVASFGGADLLEAAGAGEIDLIAGGPPCQGFSLIGKRLVDDPRNQLLAHFGRLVRQARPRYFIMENVPGMLLGDHTSVLEALIEMLETDGQYKCATPTILDASRFGVPQRRRRVILVGWRSDQDPVELPRETHGPDAGTGYVTVSQALSGLPQFGSLDQLRRSHEMVLPAEIAASLEPDHSSPRYLDHIREVGDRDAHHKRTWSRERLTNAQLTAHQRATVSKYEVLAPGETEPSHRLPRLDLNGLCNTLRAGSGRDHGAHTSPRPIHPTEPRVITVREAARLHSFPDWFRLHDTKWHGFRQVGNAVPPLLGAAIARPIAQAIGGGRDIYQLPPADESLLSLSVDAAADRLGAVAEDVPVNVRSGRWQVTSRPDLVPLGSCDPPGIRFTSQTDPPDTGHAQSQER